MAEDNGKWLAEHGFQPDASMFDGVSRTDFKKYVAGNLLVVYERSDGWHGIISSMGDIFVSSAPSAREAALEIAHDMKARLRRRRDEAQSQMDVLDTLD